MLGVKFFTLSVCESSYCVFVNSHYKNLGNNSFFV